MKIAEHLDKNNLHHAYLIEGAREEIVPELLEYIQDLGIATLGNPDFCQISIDNFKKDEALDLRSMGTEKAFTNEKKIFIVSVNSFSLDAQGILLKMFEEPIENTHFFLIVPETDALLRTLISRFYLIKTKSKIENIEKEVEEFISMPLSERIAFVKSLITDADEDDDEETVVKNSARSRALKFLNILESVLHQKVLVSKFKIDNKVDFFDKIFTAREFIRQPGSSTKTLMEMVALTVPKF